MTRYCQNHRPIHGTHREREREREREKDHSDGDGLEVIKLEYSLRLKKLRDDWLLADTCPQAANHCALF